MQAAHGALGIKAGCVQARRMRLPNSPPPGPFCLLPTQAGCSPPVQDQHDWHSGCRRAHDEELKLKPILWVSMPLLPPKWIKRERSKIKQNEPRSRQELSTFPGAATGVRSQT